MATAGHLRFYPPILTAAGSDFRRHVTTRFLSVPRRNVTPRLRLITSLEVGKEESPTVNMEELVRFLYKDLPHLFDDQGIDRTAYDERVKFRDPITKHDTITGYLLKNIFTPQEYLHSSVSTSLGKTGPYEITTRWTMVMNFLLLPWKPEIVFTGTSIMEVNPETKKFCSHLDLWDSIDNNDYFSLQGLVDVFKQLRLYKTPDLETIYHHDTPKRGGTKLSYGLKSSVWISSLRLAKCYHKTTPGERHVAIPFSCRDTNLQANAHYWWTFKKIKRLCMRQF